MAEPARQFSPEDRSLNESLQKSELERARMRERRLSQMPQGDSSADKTPSSQQELPTESNQEQSPNRENINISPEDIQAGLEKIKKIHASSREIKNELQKTKRTARTFAQQASLGFTKDFVNELPQTLRNIEKDIDEGKDWQESIASRGKKQLRGNARRSLLHALETHSDAETLSREEYEEATKRELERLVHGDKVNENDSLKKKLFKTAAKIGGAMASGRILKYMWLNLFTFYGATYIYISSHFLIRYFTPMGDYLAKFGHEWGNWKQRLKIRALTLNMGLAAAELVESAACVGIGCLLMIVFGFGIILIAFLLYVAINPYEALVEFFPYMSWKAIKCFGGVVFGVGDTCG